MLRSAFPVSRKFRKQERLCSESAVSKIFKSPTGLFVFPFKVLYQHASADAMSNQILISVPKRNFKRAVDRNLLKRRIREAYRINKALLNQDSNFLIFALVYVGKKIIEFGEIEEKLKQVLVQLGEVE